MSDWWANRIGATAAATTPPGSVPQYGVAIDTALAPWVSHADFQKFAQDQARRTRQQQIRRAEVQQAEAEEESYFNRALGAVGGFFTNLMGTLHEPALTTDKRGEELHQSRAKAGKREFSEMANQDLLIGSPEFTVKDAFQTADRYVLDPLETPFIASTVGIREKNPWWFTEGSTWAKAWNLAEEKTPAQAIADWAVNGFDPSMSNEDLERLRRTNSIYGLTVFAGDVAMFWKVDPTIVAARAAGDVRAMAKGTLPQVGQSSPTVAAAALRAARGEPGRRSFNPAEHYGRVRGKVVASNFDRLREAAQTMSFGEFVDMPMFRRNAVAGPQAALAFRIAAKDDELWDLTKRAVLADPEAWGSIRAMKMNPPEELAKFAGSDAQTYIDALRATHGLYRKMNDEVTELEELVAKRQITDPDSTPNAGFFKFYTAELDSTLQARKAKVAELKETLDKYDTHGTWLDSVPSFDNPRVSVEQVRARPASLNLRTRRVYQRSPYGKVHEVHKLSKAFVLREANPIDLHRVETGVESITRQFDQFRQFFNYAPEGALDGILEEFTRAMARDDRMGAYQIAKRIEDEHLVTAIAAKHGLEPETVTEFLNDIRFKQNQMADALVSGDGAVFSTAPGLLDRPDVKLVERKNGKMVLELAEGEKLRTVEVDEGFVDSLRPVDPTQTPNWYTPQNTRQIALAIEREWELFKDLENYRKNFGREALARLMNSTDFLGTKWNRFWKPLQLLRVAWPMRVLMDEDLRGLAMLNVGMSMRSYGEAFGKAAINAIDPLRHDPFGFSKRRKLKIGPGRLADEATGRKMDVAAHEAAMADVPFVPSYFAPKISKKRAEAMRPLLESARARRKKNMMITAWHRDELRRNVQANRDRLNPQARVVVPSLHPRAAAPAEIHTLDYDNPHNLALQSFVRDSTGTLRGGTYQKTPLAHDVVIDPLNGRRLNSGYAVPVATKELRANPGEFDQGSLNSSPAFQADFDEFLVANEELLSSGGYRVHLHKTHDGNRLHVTASVVRTFRSNERGKAVEFAQHVEANEFRDISMGHTRYVRDWNAKSPIMERLDRRWKMEEQVGFAPGTSPAAGVPPVFHGSNSGLPDELLPREDAPILRGNLYGPGFYTTVSRKIAETYATAGLYTIRGARDGKRYRVFDLEKKPNKDDLLELIAFGDEEVARRMAELSETWQIELGNAWGYARAELGIYRAITDDPANVPNWREIYERLATTNSSPDRVDTILTNFFEQKRGAGALTHVGGSFTGGAKHQVYIWLHPEELEVRPAYDKTGQWHALEEWFENPDSLDELMDIQANALTRLRAIPEDQLTDAQRGQMRVAQDAVENMPRTLRNEVPESRIDRVGPKPNELGRQMGERQAATVEREMLDPEGLDEAFDAWTPNDEAALAAEMDNVHERFIERLRRRREFARSHVRFKDAKGNKITAKGAFQDEGEIYTSLISGAPAYARLTDSYKRTLAQMRSRAVGYRVLEAPDLSPKALKTRSGRQTAREYYVAWADLLNDQIRNSPIWFRMLEGKSNDEIVDWLKRTPEGSRIRREIPHKGYNAERWVEEHRDALDYYLPRMDLQNLLKHRRVNPSDLRRIEDFDMPTVFGADLDLIAGNRGMGKVTGNVINRIFHGLGTVPTDLLARQPFFRGMYELKMRTLILATDPEKLTNDVLRAYEKRAREYGLRQVKRTMFELTDDTNFTQAVRFLAPFWGAQQEALVKWTNIMIERPETVARFYMGIEQLYNGFTVIDEDGREVNGASPGSIPGYNPNDRITFQIPEQLKKYPPFDKALDAFGSVGIAFGSVNTALQGDNPVMPSLGPWATVPADKLLRWFAEDHLASMDDNFFYRWLFPVGRPSGGYSGALEQIFPGWGRRLQSASEGQDSRSYANTWFMVYREMELDNRKKGLEPPTPEEVDKAVKWHWALRTVASFAAPAAMEFRPENQFWLDQYHEMQRKHGPGLAFEKFVQKFGADAARYAASSSRGIVPPTRKGMREWKQHRRLVREFPEWASAMISPEAWAEDFSSDSYRAQFEIPLGPGTNRKLRVAQDPDERVAATDARLGWLEYRKLQSALNAELFARGLTSLEQNGAEDLRAMKDFKVDQLKEQLPGWREDFNTYSNSIYDRVEELRAWADAEAFDNRPDIQGVRQYMAIRDETVQALEFYAAATGGSRSLQAGENEEIRKVFYARVGQLVQDNPAFGEFYARFLSTDTLERGAG